MRRPSLGSFASFLAISVALAWLAQPAQARWPSDPRDYITLTPGGINTGVQDACPDGAGGAFVCWGSESPAVVPYIQHLDAFGREVFTAGVWVADTSSGVPIQLAPAPACGVVTLTERWLDDGAGMGLALHAIGATGQRLWTNRFWQGSGFPADFFWTQLAVGPSGNDWTAVWLDSGSGPGVLRAQRINAAGNCAWGDTGAVVASPPTAPHLGPIAVDAQGGVWVSFIKGSYEPNVSIHLQYLTPGGTPAWPGEGVPVVAGPYVDRIWQMIADGAGGAWISWSVTASAPDHSDRLQRVRADGSIALAPEGLAMLGPSPTIRGCPALGAGPGGRAWVAWQAPAVLHPDYAYETRAQMLDTTGTWLWPGDGTVLGASQAEWLGVRIYPNQDGSATITVHPAVYGGFMGAARVAADGTPLWPAPAPLMVLRDPWQIPFGPIDNPGIVPTGDGGVMDFSTMADSGLGSDDHAYFVRAQHLDGNGRSGDTAPRIVVLRDAPDDAGGWVDVRWHASSLEGDSTMATTGYDVLRADPDGAGATTLAVVATRAAAGDSEYVARVPTLADSTSPSSRPAVFRVRARDAADRTWLSPPDSASSYPNQPPASVGPGATLALALDAPRPSPATAATRIRYTLPVDTRLSLGVFDIAGRRVRTLAEGWQTAGEHIAELAPAFEAGRRLAPGVYFALLETPGHRLTRRIVVAR